MNDNYEPTLEDWKQALASDLAILAGLLAIAKNRGMDQMRRMNIEATKRRIKDARREIEKIKRQSP